MKYTPMIKIASITTMVLAFCGSWIAIYDNDHLRALIWVSMGLWAWSHYVSQNTIQSKMIARMVKEELENAQKCLPNQDKK